MRWVDTIATSAKKGQDRLYKTLLATLVRHLYDHELPGAHKSIVNGAKAKGTIDYKQDEQALAIHEIVELIAVDLPTTVISPLISFFIQVTGCLHHRSGGLTAFISRFRGIIAEQLMHGGLSVSSQVGEVLAIMLQNNSAFSEDTITNAKLQIIAVS